MGPRGASQKRSRKSDDFGGSRTLKIELSCKRELNFHFGPGTPKRYQNGSQNGGQMDPKSTKSRCKVVPGGVQKNVEKQLQKSVKNESPRAAQNHTKINKKRQKQDTKKRPASRRIPKGSQGRPGGRFLINFNDFLMRFSVFPCVYYNLLLKSGVLSCVYCISTFHFYMFF